MGAATAVREPGKERAARAKPRVTARPRPAAPTVARPHFAELHRTLGNLGIQRLLTSGLLRGQEDALRTGLTSSELAALASTAGAPTKTPGAPAAPIQERSSPVPRAATAGAPSVSTSQPPESADGPVATESADVGAEAPRRAAVTTPDQDAGYQRVVRTLGAKAKRLKTPVKEAGDKKLEVEAAAKLPPSRQKEEVAYDQQLKDMGSAPIPEIKDVTVSEFMAAFQKGFTELAKQIPKASEDNRAISNAVDFSSEKAVAVQELKAKRDVTSEPLRTAASKDPLKIAAEAASPGVPPSLVLDPAGPVPTVPNAAAAAPKPLPSSEISLDAQSQALDDALTNQVAGGQVVNISEASLAFPVSGEKSFDEAGEAKRKAQDAIRKLIPGYRATEAGILKKAGNAAAHTVRTGLQDYHGVREHSFGGVLEVQKGHERTVETEKDAVLGQFARTFAEKKKLVEDELASLNGVGEEFEKLLTEAEKELKRWVRNNLEYIYTPGLFDYSDWIDKREGDVRKEYERLSKGRLNLGWDPITWMKALKTIQDRDATELFKEAKQYFLDNITAHAHSIANKVVESLNRANKHIRDGLSEAKVIYDSLSTKEKSEYAGAFDAVVGQYTTLAETVADRHREIVSDMARSYHKVAATLDATFEAIRKDVLTSLWEKAWNKIKSVVNAVIEFATRIAELLVGMLHLLGEIISSPRYFFNNLVTGIGRGLSTFVGRIDEFLADAFFDWLRGSAGASIQLPTVWDAKGIFGLFTQLLGLSVETIWQRMEVVYDKTIANAFRRGEVVLDKGLELFGILRSEGLGGLWTHIQESLGTILTDTLTSMKETVLYAAIKKVIIEVGKLLVPGGGFIAIAEKIIRLLQFIVEARNKILDLIQSFMESMELAVRGDVSGIVTRITGALKQFITVALDFLVTFFGLGGLKSKVERVIDRTRSPIIRAIDWLLGKLKPLVMRVLGVLEKGKEKVLGTGRRAVTAVAGWLGVKKTFTVRKGEQHTLFFDRSVQLMMASNSPVVFSQFVNSVRIPPHKARELGPLVLRLLSRLREVDSILANTAIEENDRQRVIQARLELIGPDVAELIRETSAALLTSEAPVYGGLYGAQFGSSMRVRIVDGRPATRGSKPSVTNTYWDVLRKRKTSPGARDTFYVRAHLLNRELGGPGDDWHNLSILSQQANVRDWYGSGSHNTVEARLKGPLSQPGKGFVYVVTANYGRRVNSTLVSAIDELIRHKSNPRTVPLPSVPAYLTSYTIPQLRTLSLIVAAEALVPTGFVCAVTEIDAAGALEHTGRPSFEVSNSDHNITRAIENDIEGQYFV